MAQWQKLVEIAQEVIEETIAGLPENLRILAERLPLSFDPHPSPEMQEDGIDGDVLGLFVGESHEDFGHGADPLPGQILLFLQNLWDFAEEEIDAYREEVRVTYLHELGHYLGWDEQDLLERDLD